jgi:hypothetical protein
MSTFFGVTLSIAVVFGLPFLLVKYVGSKTGPTDDSRHIGIKGWLALLIALMGIVGPLYVTGILYSGFDDLERSYPAVLRSPEYSSYKSSAIFISAVVVLVQVYSAWRLLASRDLVAVILLKRFLIASPFLAFCYPLLGSFYFEEMGPDQWGEAIRSFVGVSLANAVWYLYLSKSKRISATYREPGEFAFSDFSWNKEIATRSIDRETSKVVNEVTNNKMADFQILNRNRRSTIHLALAAGSTEKRFKGISNLERIYGIGQVDQAKWAECLTSSEFDEIRACAKYWRK